MKTLLRFKKGPAWPKVLPLLLLFAQTRLQAVTFTDTPSAVSNLYSGVINLQVTGLNTGETVVLQKFLDANSNGVVDAGDFLVQQFQVADGQAASAVAGITNNNVPYDSNPTNGSITVKLDPQLGGIVQSLVGQFLYVLSSPSNHFTPITNLFNVTNTPYLQGYSGIVYSNGTSTYVPNALVFLTFPFGDGFNPLACTVADSTGHYNIKAPPGTYRLIATKYNYVSAFSNSPTLVLGAGSNISTNLSIFAATTNVSGKFEDTNTLAGLPGMLAGASSSDGLYLALFTSDTNGNFTVPLNAEQWKIGEDQGPLSMHGYAGLNGGPKFNTTNGNPGTVTIGFTPATALIYGRVTDGLNNPLPGVNLEGNNGNNDSGEFQGQAETDQNGNYAIGIVAGNWGVDADNSLNGVRFPNYVCSQLPWDYNSGGNGSNITAGQAVQANFTALAAPYQITGWLKDNNSNPIVGVQVNASATINNTNFRAANAYTDANGNYTLNVVNTNTWYVGVNCCGGGDCGNSSLPSNYQCPDNNNQGIPVNNASVPNINFVATQCALQIITNNLPGGTVNDYYDTFLSANGCNPPFSWNNVGVTLPPPGLTLYSSGEINGYPTASGTFTFSVQVTDNNNNQTSTNLSITIAPGVPPPLQITSASLGNATQGVFYTTQLTATGGVPPYGWTPSPGSAPLPSALSLSSNGVLSGYPTAGGSYSFWVRVTDTTSTDVDQLLSLTVNVSTNNPHLSLTGMSRAGNGAFQFSFDSAAGVNYTTEISSDLKNWVLLGTITGSGGPLTVVDLTATTSPRYYRLKITP